MVKIRRNFQAREIVEDAAQETLMRVLKNLRANPALLDEPGKLGAYVLGVCNNVVRELARSERRYVGMDGAEDGRPCPESNAMEILCGEERKKRAQAILSELAPRDRNLLRMVFYEERDKDEICREMKVDRDYLRVVLHRAIQRCKALAAGG